MKGGRRRNLPISQNKRVEEKETKSTDKIIVKYTKSSLGWALLLWSVVSSPASSPSGLGAIFEINSTKLQRLISFFYVNKYFNLVRVGVSAFHIWPQINNNYLL